MNGILVASSAILAGGLVFIPVSPSATEIALGAPAGAPITWTVDPVHSSVQFRILHLGASWSYGRFDAMTGAVILDVANPSASSVQFTVDVASVNTANKDRDDHLRGPDFFNAKVNPKISFQSTEVTRDSENRFQVTGILILNGKERKITFPAELVGTGKNMQNQEVAGFEAVFTIRRSEFGVSIYPDALGDEVRITVSIEAVKKA